MNLNKNKKIKYIYIKNKTFKTFKKNFDYIFFIIKVRYETINNYIDVIQF